MLNEILTSIGDALLAIPGARLVLGLFDSSLRPFVAGILVVGVLYLLSRAAHFVSIRAARKSLRTDDFTGRLGQLRAATPESGTRIVPEARPASGEFRTSGEQRIVSRETRTPSAEMRAISREVPAVGSPWLNSRTLTLSVGAVVVAVIALVTLSRRGVATSGKVPDSLFVLRTSDSAFRFEDAGWRLDQEDCLATIRVTALGQRPRRLELSVSDPSGSVIGRANLDSPTVAVGTLLDFRLSHVDCRRVNEWAVQGEFEK